MFKKGDIVLIAAIAALALIIGAAMFFDGGGQPEEAIVSVGGKQVKTLPLDTDVSYTICENGHTNVIEVRSGKVRMVSADCPDGLCVGQGWIDSEGQTLVCLPNRVTVTLRTNSETAPDAVVY